jgi:hypothetical protein
MKIFVVLLTLCIGESFGQSVVRGPYLQTPTENSIIVMWRSNVATNSVVWYGTDSTQLNSSAAGNNNATDHTVNLTGLQPYTKYFYAVGDQAIYGGGTSNHFFYTAPVIGSQDSIRIWSIGDFGKGNAGQIAVKNSYLSWTGSKHTNVWLWLGDNVYSDGKDAEYQSKVFGLNGFKDIFSWLPFMPTPGNHDYNQIWQESAFLGIPYSNIPLENHQGPYYNIVDVPEQAEAGGFPSNLEVFYSFDYGNVHFLSLNSEVYDFLNTGTGIQRMIDYIHDDLSQNTSDFTIAYFHQPPYSKGSHDSDAAQELVMKTMREDVVPILESYDVDIILCGHSHVYERSYLIKNHYGNSSSWNPAAQLVNGTNGSMITGNPYVKQKFNQQHDGTVYVVCGNSGSENSNGPMNHPIFCHGDNGAGVTGSFVMDVYRNRLDGKYLRSDGTIQDEFTLLKQNMQAVNALDTLCLGDTIVLTALQSGGSDSLSILWSGLGLAQPQIAVNPEQSTTYSCTVTDYLTGQEITSTYQIHVQECISNLEESAIAPFVLYPNPSKGMVEISCEEVMNSLKVLDASGKKVHEAVPMTKKTILTLSHLPAGNYSFEVQVKSGIFRKSLVLAP